MWCWRRASFSLPFSTVDALYEVSTSWRRLPSVDGDGTLCAVTSTSGSRLVAAAFDTKAAAKASRRSWENPRIVAGRARPTVVAFLVHSLGCFGWAGTNADRGMGKGGSSCPFHSEQLAARDRSELIILPHVSVDVPQATCPDVNILLGRLRDGNIIPVGCDSCEAIYSLLALSSEREYVGAWSSRASANDGTTRRHLMRAFAAKEWKHKYVFWSIEMDALLSTRCSSLRP